MEFAKFSIVLQWVLGCLFLLFTVANGLHWSSLLILLAAVLMLPVPKIRSVFKKIEIKKF